MILSIIIQNKKSLTPQRAQQVLSKKGKFPFFQFFAREWDLTLKQPCYRDFTLQRNMRSKIRWFTRFCNSHYVSQFAAFFIDARAKRSTVKSCRYICFFFCFFFLFLFFVHSLYFFVVYQDTQQIVPRPNSKNQKIKKSKRKRKFTTAVLRLCGSSRPLLGDGK